GTGDWGLEVEEPSMPEDESPMPAATKGAAMAKRTAAKSATIMIVDDEEGVRMFVDRVLRDGGYRTILASDGTDALELAGKLGPFDALVTDLMMPLMAGDELARRFRLNDPNLKVLYLTGYTERLFKEKTTLWADEAFLEKPCTMKGLREAVSLLL